MKKYIVVLSILIFVCGFNTVVCAAPADSNGWETDVVFNTVIDTLEDGYNITIPDTVKAQWWNGGYNPQDNYYLFITDDGQANGFIRFYFYSSGQLNDEQTVITLTNPGFSSYYEKSTTAFLAYATGNWTRTLQAGDTVIGYFNDLVSMPDGVDYGIPVPDARLVTIDNDGMNWDNTPINNFRLQIKTPNVNLTDLMVEVQVKYYTPSKVYINTYMWNKSEFVPAEYLISSVDNIVPLATKTLLTSLPVNTSNEYRWQVDLNVNNGWENFYNANVTANVPSFYWAASGDEVQQGTALVAIGKFNSQQKYLPSSFNICEVFVRYFKQESGQIKVGQWLHLKNDTTLDNDALNVQIPVINPPVSQNTSPILELPDEQNSIDTGVWLPGGNGTGVSVVVQNNMPEQNNLNYPTIVSYNHDIVFKQWADTAKGIPNFFQSVTAFATMAFSFIPAEVWAIVSMGLLLSIAVMVIKIL